MKMLQFHNTINLNFSWLILKSSKALHLLPMRFTNNKEKAWPDLKLEWLISKSSFQVFRQPVNCSRNTFRFCGNSNIVSNYLKKQKINKDQVFSHGTKLIRSFRFWTAELSFWISQMILIWTPWWCRKDRMLKNVKVEGILQKMRTNHFDLSGYAIYIFIYK